MAETYDIKLKMSEDERNALGQRLLQQITDARNGMREMLSDMKNWDKYYEGTLPEKTEPWDSCSNINIPLIQTHVDTYTAHAGDVILSVRPLTLIQPPPEMGSDPQIKSLAQKVEDMLESIETEWMDLPSILADELIPASMRNPAGVAKVAWREEYRTVREESPAADPMTGEPMLDEMGQPQVQIVEKTVPAYRGPKPEYVDLRNFVIFPLTAKSKEDAILIGHRFRLTADGIRRRVQDGTFEKSALDLIDSMETEASSSQQTEDEEMLDYIGIERSSYFDQLWFWEVIAGYAVKKGGLEEDCCFTIEASTGKLVRAVKYPYYHGLRYYVDMVPFPRPGYYFGRCIPGILENCQQELNAIHNQRVDSTSLAISLAFKLKTSSMLDPDAVRIYPGAVIPVNEVDELTEFKLSPVIPGMDIEQEIRDYAERASGINDVSMGRMTEGQKTAREVAIVNAEGGIRFQDIIRRMQKTVTQIAEQTVGLCRQFMSDEELARFGVNREILSIPWVYVPHGNTGVANKVQQRQESMLLYRTLLGGEGVPPNPMVVGDPLRLWRITQDMLQAFDRQDTEAYIGTQQDAEMLKQMQEQQMAAEQQAQQQMMMEQKAMQAEQMRREDEGTQREQQNKQADRESRMQEMLMKGAMMGGRK